MDLRLIGLLGLLVIFLSSLVKYPEEKVVFLDVGQGDATLIQNKTVQILVDGGPDSYRRGDRRRAGRLEERGGNLREAARCCIKSAYQPD